VINLTKAQWMEAGIGVVYDILIIAGVVFMASMLIEAGVKAPVLIAAGLAVVVVCNILDAKDKDSNDDSGQPPGPPAAA
jgi:hypothetical protein